MIVGVNLEIWTLGGYITPLRKTGDTFGYPAWSPDGQLIAFISSELGRRVGYTPAYDIFISNLDGSIYRDLTENIDANSEAPSWSPDGKNLAFGAAPVIDNPDPDSRWREIFVNYDVFVVNIEDPSHPINLTNNPADDTYPLWSPDGERIAFLSTRGGAWDLYTMKADGTDVRQVTQLSIDFPRWGSYVWLPDSKYILFNDYLIELETGIKTPLVYDFYARDATWLIVDGPAALSPIATPNCAGPRSYFYPGVYAVVSGMTGDPPNNVRSGPGTSDPIIAKIYPGTIVKVLDGPICSDGLVFWRVESNFIPGGSGWVAEGNGEQSFFTIKYP